MKTGQKLKSSNGYVWTVIQVIGKSIKIESDGIIETISLSDIKALISIHHYQLV